MPSLDQRPQTRHSSTVTSDAYEGMNRQHFLDYVVGKPTTDERGDNGISQRIVGLLFHEYRRTLQKEQAARQGRMVRDCYERPDNGDATVNYRSKTYATGDLETLV